MPATGLICSPASRVQQDHLIPSSVKFQASVKWYHLNETSLEQSWHDLTRGGPWFLLREDPVPMQQHIQSFES